MVALIAAFLCLFMAYEWFRRKTNKTRIGGLEYFLCKILKRDDYVSINGKVMRFSHISHGGESIDILKFPTYDNKTLGGELAFAKPHGLGYYFYPMSVLRECEFIYGEYGLKWAVSKHWAEIAKEKVDEY